MNFFFIKTFLLALHLNFNSQMLDETVIDVSCFAAEKSPWFSHAETAAQKTRECKRLLRVCWDVILTTVIQLGGSFPRNQLAPPYKPLLFAAFIPLY